MDLAAFKKTLSANEPPAGINVYLKALWYESKGDWEKAHILVQDMTDKNASWVHAYLHRKEGDTWNADYWYSKASKKRPSVSLDEEWEQMAAALI
jgi:hypothetical protein